MSENFKKLAEKHKLLKDYKTQESPNGKVLFISIQEERATNVFERLLAAIEILLENGYDLSGPISLNPGKYLGLPLYTATLILKDQTSKEKRSKK